jgi:hypothetical protein
MSEDTELPTDIEVGDAYALRTFKAEDGRLVSVTQRGGHWEDGVCIATCLKNPDHVAPVRNCTCGVYAFWTVEELLDQYLESARSMVAVVRLDGDNVEGDKGVRARAAQIVAWWCAEDAHELAAACTASIPGTRRHLDRNVVVRRYFERDVMLGLYPPPSPEERNRGEENQDG